MRGRNGWRRPTVAPLGVRICPWSLAVLTPLLRRNLTPLVFQNLTPLLLKIVPNHVQNFVQIAFTRCEPVFGICNGISNKIYPDFVKICCQPRSNFRGKRVQFLLPAAFKFRRLLLCETWANWDPSLGSGEDTLETRPGYPILIEIIFLNG